MTCNTPLWNLTWNQLIELLVLFVLDSNTWNNLTVFKQINDIEKIMSVSKTWNRSAEYKQISFNTFKNKVSNKLFTYTSYIYISISISCCPTVVEGNLKAPFSVATIEAEG